MIAPFSAKKVQPAVTRLTKKSPKPTLVCGTCERKVCEVARPIGSIVWQCAACECSTKSES